MCVTRFCPYFPDFFTGTLMSVTQICWIWNGLHRMTWTDNMTPTKPNITQLYPYFMGHVVLYVCSALWFISKYYSDRNEGYFLKNFICIFIHTDISWYSGCWLNNNSFSIFNSMSKVCWFMIRRWDFIGPGGTVNLIEVLWLFQIVQCNRGWLRIKAIVGRALASPKIFHGGR